MLNDAYNADPLLYYAPISEADANARLASQDEWIAYWQAREGAAITLGFEDKAAEAAAAIAEAVAIRQLYVDALDAILNPPEPEEPTTVLTDDEQEAAIAALINQELGLTGE